ncbi:MAG: hypothetical protein KJZ73_17305 [Pseudorhodoplanes sp.]|nr:hypothetical protein [Pseudorhodoplanes sp.]GIK81233.1 MAG: hypothetical protein BroJett024_23380 [Alphaproteobacteria bacterium]
MQEADMATRNPDRNRTRNVDHFTRGSFTFRGMEAWQVWAISAVAVIVLALLIGSYVT